MYSLNDSQKEAVVQNGNVLVCASPGSGKTRTLIARAQHRLKDIPQYKYLALITYTNAAADEMASRMDCDDSIFTGTIHRFCLEYILRPFGWIYGWSKPKIISYEQKKHFVDTNEGFINLGNSPLNQLDKITKTLDGGLNLEVDWSLNTPIEEVADLYFEYLKDINRIDFNEVLYRSYKVISENDFVCTSLASKFYEILVDEFQDTNLFQYEILKRIYSKNLCTFFFVGDARQSIMGFAGALSDVFERVLDDYEISYIRLNDTYRSTSNIVNAYYSLFNDHDNIQNKSRYRNTNIPIVLDSCKDGICGRCDGCDKDLKLVKSYIDMLIEGGVLQDKIAILSSRWNDCKDIGNFLRRYYNVVGIGSLPHSLKDIMDSSYELLISIVKFINKRDTKHLRSVKRSIDIHLLESGIEYEGSLIILLNNLIKDFESINVNLSLEQGFREIKLAFDKHFMTNHTTMEKVITLINPQELHDWNLEKYFRTIIGTGGIQNQTIHSSKGLEFEAVIINHVDEGRIPFGGFNRTRYVDASDKDIVNGKKLLYVALSRPQKHLIILYGRNGSRFIERLI